jgi:hypothetical protein
LIIVNGEGRNMKEMKESSWYKELKQVEAGELSFWTTGRKAYIGVAFIVFILLFSYVGSSGYLSYTGPNGSYAWTSTDKTFIECSNGNRYNATWSNIQVAVNSLGEAAGVVHVPLGNFSVTSTLWINNSAISIIGSGNGGRAIQSPKNNGTIFYIAANLPNGVIKVTGRSVPTYNNIWNTVFSDFGIVGNSARTYATTGINFTFAWQPIIERVDFSYIRGTALWFDDCRLPTIRDCKFGGCGETDGYQAVVYFVGTTDVTTTPFVSNNCFQYGFYCFINSSQTSPAFGYGSNNGVIADNYFEGNLSVLYGVIPTEEMIVRGNQFLGNVSKAYIYSPTYYGRWCIFDGNTFVHGGGGGSTETYAQISLKGCYDMKIVNNLFYWSANNGLYLDASCTNITISGNTFDYLIGHGIYSWGDTTLISGNNFRGIPPGFVTNKCAVYLREGATHNSIVNNFITNCERGINGATTDNPDTQIVDNTIIHITDASRALYNFGADDYISGNIGDLTMQMPLTAPTNPVAGDMWINTTTGFIMYYYGATATLAHIHVNAT